MFLNSIDVASIIVLALFCINGVTNGFVADSSWITTPTIAIAFSETVRPTFVYILKKYTLINCATILPNGLLILIMIPIIQIIITIFKHTIMKFGLFSIIDKSLGVVSGFMKYAAILIVITQMPNMKFINKRIAMLIVNKDFINELKTAKIPKIVLSIYEKYLENIEKDENSTESQEK